GRAEVVAPVAGGEAVVLGEAAGVGVVGVLAAVVPLAEAGGGVAGGPEGFADGLFAEVEALAAGGDAADAAARVVAAGEVLDPRRRTDRADVEALEGSPVAGQGIDVRRVEVGVAVGAEVAPALVVGEDDDDVRPTLRRGRGQARRDGEGGQEGRSERYFH